MTADLAAIVRQLQAADYRRGLALAEARAARRQMARAEALCAAAAAELAALGDDLGPGSEALSEAICARVDGLRRAVRGLRAG